MRNYLAAGEASLRPQPHEDYGRLSLDLGTARTDEEIPIHGDYLAKISYDGGDTTTYFRIDQRHAAKIYPKEFKAMRRRYARIFLTNTAQAGKTLVLQINELAVSEIEPDNKITDTDSLAAIATDAAALEVDLAAIEALAITIDADTSAIATDIAAIEALAITIDTDTGYITTATEAMAVWDDGSDHCETKEYFSGTPYRAAKTCAATEALFHATPKLLRRVEIRNTHATLYALLGTTGALTFPLKAGESITLEWIDLNRLYFIDGDGHATLELLGVEK